jgi:hypothetical protein
MGARKRGFARMSRFAPGLTAAVAMVVAVALGASPRAWAKKRRVLDPADLSVPTAKPSSQPMPARPAAPKPAPSAAPSEEPLPPPAPPPAEPRAAAAASPTPRAPGDARTWGGSLALGFPHPFFAGLEYRHDASWSGGVGFGGAYFPDVLWDGDVHNVNVLAADVRARWHPWQGAFFVGLAAGVQRIDDGASVMVPVTVTSPSGNQVFNTVSSLSASITSVYLTPHVGWMKVYESGFLLGFEAGLQVPISMHNSLDTETTDDGGLTTVGINDIVNTSQYINARGKVSDAIHDIGTLPMPYFTVARVGWMF